jgi:hypothetical protein
VGGQTDTCEEKQKEEKNEEKHVNREYDQGLQ